MTAKKKKGCLIGCLIPIIIIAIILTIAALADAGDKKEKKDATKQVSNASLPLEERVEAAAISVLGLENNMGDSRNIEVTTKEGLTSVSFLTNDHWEMVESMEKETISLLEALKEIEEIDELEVNLQFSFLDEYGKESIKTALNVTVLKSEINKINFENFRGDQLKNISSSYKLHPGVQK